MVQKAKAASVAAVGTTATNIASKSGYMATAFGITDFLGSEPGRGNIVLNEYPSTQREELTFFPHLLLRNDNV